VTSWMRLFLGLSVRLVRLDAGAGGAELAGPVVVADVDFFFTEYFVNCIVSSYSLSYSSLVIFFPDRIASLYMASV
jgi:hypothetical protein